MNKEILAKLKERISNNQALNSNVIEQIINYNSLLPKNIKRDENIEHLKSRDTLRVVSGQQVGIFLGDALTLHKAISLLAYANYFQKEFKKKCVPIFWLQTEDHDFEEISKIKILDSNNELKSFKLSSNNTNDSISNLKLNSEIELFKETLKTEMSLKFSEEKLIKYFEIFSNYYKDGISPGFAFSSVLSEVLADFGLVFFDPNFQEIKSTFSSFFVQSFTNANEIDEALNKHNETLQKKDFKTPIKLRPGFPLFFINSSITKFKRKRISLKEIKENYTENEFIDFIKKETNSISNSALLRPVFQDLLLSPIAYIGGKAEVSYLRQVEPLYEIFNVNSSIPILRHSNLLLDAPSQKLISNLKLDETLNEIRSYEEFEDFIRKNVEDTSKSRLFDAEIHSIKNKLSDIEKENIKIDPNLIKNFKKVEEKILGMLESIQKKAEIASKSKNSIQIDRINRLVSLIFPNKNLQEREISSIYELIAFDEVVKKLFDIDCKTLEEKDFDPNKIIWTYL